MCTRATLAMIALWLSTAAAPTLGATCSCAGVPLLSSMEFGTPDNKSWFLSSSYEFHDISDLVSGTDDVSDSTDRKRKSQTLILEASYGINDRFSVSTLFSAVEHERTVGQSGTARASGLGDGIVMFKYTPGKVGLFKRNGLAFGIGSRIPIGEDNASDIVTLAEDMQPSTGAWAGIFWVQASRSFSRAAKTQVFSSFSYTENFENDRDYRFGNTWSLSLGGSYQTDTPWNFGVEMRYRNSDRDQRNSVEIPNTGGQWLDLVPAVQYHFNDKLAGKITARIPVWRDLNDVLQFTTSYSVALSISYLFSLSS